MDKAFDKKYENKEWLENELKTKTSRAVAKEIGVSYKLINAWGVTHGLIIKNDELELA